MQCIRCQKEQPLKNFPLSHGWDAIDGRAPVCSRCFEKQIEKRNTFSYINKIFEYLDIPFYPEKWAVMVQDTGEEAFSLYCNAFGAAKRTTPDWDTVNKEYLELKSTTDILRRFPDYDEQTLLELQHKWGAGYLPEELADLESLYAGILETYGVVGKLQVDQAKKICKMSLTIDQKIRDGENPKDWINSYSKTISDANFLPKNIQDGNEFSSFGEVWAFLEKGGWSNHFYQNQPMDSVDFTMEQIQKYNRDLFINESELASDIERRIEALSKVDKAEARENEEALQYITTMDDEDEDNIFEEDAGL